MIGQPFHYHAPLTLTAAADLLGALADDAVVLGGGTMLVPAMSANQVRPANVIGLSALKLDHITRRAGYVYIGAMTTYAQLLASADIAHSLPLLRLMADGITGGPSIWNQGTLGGSAAYANPASDAPACLVALQASFELLSTEGVRTLPARDFYLGAFRTARRSTELLIGIRVPVQDAACASHYDKHKSCASSWPIVTVASFIHPGPQAQVRLAVGGAAACPVYQARQVDRAELHPSAAWIDDLAASVVAGVGEGWSDELADGAYRRAITAAVVRRNLKTTIERIQR
ncbi:FAD binding domain-containing protein [Pseudomonas sp. UBA1879]|uniref:FAD binding domain-containing protein n=1 Tax=Pseudomonas sp. UBA1879 TaxID=1947305 RepID=UPI0025EC510F|nr:FAD binding domain-containing protein [Pseudomonas sp. UBA1879]